MNANNPRNSQFGNQPPLKLSTERLTKYYMLFLQGSVVAFMALALLFLFLYQSMVMAYTCVLFALLMGGFIFALKKTTDTVPVINVSIFSFFAFFMLASIMTGGSLGAFGTTVLAIPIIAFFLVGLQSARFWFAVCLLLYFAERALALFGVSFPNDISTGLENVSKAVVYLAVLCGPFFILEFFTRKRFLPHYALDDGHDLLRYTESESTLQVKQAETAETQAKMQAIQHELNLTMEKVTELQAKIEQERAVQGKNMEIIRSYEENIRQLATTSPDSFHLYDAALNWLDINDAALHLLGKNKQDLVGKNLLELAPSLKETGRYDLYQQVMMTGKPVYFDDVIPTGKGRLHFRTCVFKFGDGCAILTKDVSDKTMLKAV